MAAFSTFFRSSWRGPLNSTFPTTEPDRLVINAEDIRESGATLEPLPIHAAALEPQAPCAEMGLWWDAGRRQLTALRETKLATSGVWCREVGATDLLPLLALLNPHHQQSSVSAVRCWDQAVCKHKTDHGGFLSLALFMVWRPLFAPDVDLKWAIWNRVCLSWGDLGSWWDAKIQELSGVREILEFASTITWWQILEFARMIT